MKHRYNHKEEAASTLAASVSTVIFSIIASSHHWLHMGILLVLGGSTNAMGAMTGVVWIRRVMIFATLFTTVFAVYRMVKRKHMPLWMKGLTSFSIIVSIGFTGYTFVQFGW
ncbi:hypothetical protein KZ483_04530 [Paenibacillus sp. sptzw28]|uniref:hypothetical protein n=1 Tax=Paenibacillus sp. sptzw28 TaxID=715179 RepID=UPI001C6E1308|nr:hypothetical protein [Paenibacillus sp. sptzw28]QYR22268.1 hypothetical protein KZ483_04530 [Paenibacillus sp. sptzw28]